MAGWSRCSADWSDCFVLKGVIGGLILPKATGDLEGGDGEKEEGKRKVMQGCVTGRGQGGRKRSGRGRSGGGEVTDGGDATCRECDLGVHDMLGREGMRRWDVWTLKEWKNCSLKNCSLVYCHGQRLFSLDLMPKSPRILTRPPLLPFDLYPHSVFKGCQKKGHFQRFRNDIQNFCVVA